MKAAVKSFIGLVILAWPAWVFAGFTDTLPQGTWLLDAGFIISNIDSRWDDEGEKVTLVDPVTRYEPGAGKQGILKPMVEVQYGILAFQVYYGILDNLVFGVGVPVVLYTNVDPNFQWEEGDYQWNLGRAYSQQDFWEWAESMGQPKPEPWSGNHGVLGDIQLGLRYRFTDGINWFQNNDLALSVMLMGVLPTGTQADPEELLSAGTTSWDLHSNGDVGLHVSVDKFFKRSLDGRLTLGLDAFYEALLPHQYISPEGKKNPLMLNYRPFTGKYYTIDGGDFSGGSAQADIVPWQGPAYGTWLTKGDQAKAEALPPLLTLSLRYTFIYLQQTDWESDSAIWDWDREKLWKPGYKNILWGQAMVSLLRLGAPIQPYVNYRNLSWIPGKNARAADALTAGTRVLMKFW